MDMEHEIKTSAPSGKDEGMQPMPGRHCSVEDLATRALLPRPRLTDSEIAQLWHDAQVEWGYREGYRRPWDSLGMDVQAELFARTIERHIRG